MILKISHINVITDQKGHNDVITTSKANYKEEIFKKNVPLQTFDIMIGIFKVIFHDPKLYLLRPKLFILFCVIMKNLFKSNDLYNILVFNHFRQTAFATDILQEDNYS